MEFFIRLPFSSVENTAKEEKKAGRLSETWDSKAQVCYSGHLRVHTLPASSKLAEHRDFKEPMGLPPRLPGLLVFFGFCPGKVKKDSQLCKGILVSYLVVLFCAFQPPSCKCSYSF